MRRDLRLTGGKPFSLVAKEGHGWANQLLVLKSLPNGLPRSRFGVVAGKRLGQAVVRNRLKRRLREILRQMPVKAGWDVVLIARRDAPGRHYHHLKSSVEELLRRARLLEMSTGRSESGT